MHLIQLKQLPDEENGYMGFYIDGNKYYQFRLTGKRTYTKRIKSLHSEQHDAEFLASFGLSKDSDNLLTDQVAVANLSIESLAQVARNKYRS